MAPPKMTLATQAVLAALLTHTQPAHVTQIAAAAHLDTGTAAPILKRLHHAGWATEQWEDVDPRKAGRPRRHHYRLTEHGAEQARAALAARKGRTP